MTIICNYCCNISYSHPCSSTQHACWSTRRGWVVIGRLVPKLQVIIEGARQSLWMIAVSLIKAWKPSLLSWAGSTLWEVHTVDYHHHYPHTHSHPERRRGEKDTETEKMRKMVLLYNSHVSSLWNCITPLLTCHSSLVHGNKRDLSACKVIFFFSSTSAKWETKLGTVERAQ